MLAIKVATFAVATAGLATAAYLMVRIAILARGLPDLPLSIRINPFNILASRRYWTPEIAALERKAAWGLTAFIGGVLLFLVASVFEPGG